MRNPFKKYGHFYQGRLDYHIKNINWLAPKPQSINPDLSWIGKAKKILKKRLKLFENQNKKYEKFLNSIHDNLIRSTIIPGNNQFEKLSVQEWTEKYRIKTGNLQEAIKRISISAKQAAENMEKAVKAMNKLSHPS